MKNKSIKDVSCDKCVGCTACVNICPKNCIKMQVDQEGFAYPVIDAEQCINCGRCYKACPTIKNEKQKYYPRALGMINRSQRIREESSSGGIFYNLGRFIIEEGGVVCAATLDDGMRVKHILVDDIREMECLMKSKYVQSDLGNCYSQILELLTQGKKVLFVGTPCQVCGLRTFLGKEYENLFRVDLICHGVPSPQIWREFVENIENEKHSKCNSVSFRNRTLEGWKNFGMKIEFEDGSTYIDTQKQNPYMFGFLKGYIDRKCCYDCQFKGINRCSDLTIGDFWSVDKYEKGFNDNKGTSLVYVNTLKGKKMIEEIKNYFYIRKIEEKNFWDLNIAYSQSTLCVKNREKFFRKYIRRNNAIDILRGEMKRQGIYL